MDSSSERGAVGSNPGSMATSSTTPTIIVAVALIPLKPGAVSVHCVRFRTSLCVNGQARVSLRDVTWNDVRQRERGGRGEPGSTERMHWDTSEHDWLEGRDEKLSLDRDARSGSRARFVGHDSTEENLRKLGCYVKQCGQPVSVHTDQASLFQIAPGPAITGMIRNSN